MRKKKKIFKAALPILVQFTKNPTFSQNVASGFEFDAPAIFKAFIEATGGLSSPFRSKYDLPDPEKKEWIN